MKVENVHATCVADNCIKVEVESNVQCKDNVICEYVDLMTMGKATAVHNGGVKWQLLWHRWRNLLVQLRHWVKLHLFCFQWQVLKMVEREEGLPTV